MSLMQTSTRARLLAHLTSPPLRQTYTHNRAQLCRRYQTLPSQNAASFAPPPQRSTISRALRFTAKWSLLTGLACFTGGLVGLNLLPNRDALIALFNGPALTNAETLAFSPSDPTLRAINDRLVNSPIATQLRATPDMTEWRPHLRIPDSIKPTNLTGGVLAGAGRIAVPPLVFTHKRGESSVVLFYLGEQLCGHPGIVHGGLLATLLDEGLARCCFGALPNKMAVTANLQIDYRKPAMADKYYVLRAETTKVEGRKAWVRGWIEEMGDGEGSETPAKIAEATALFIEPRNAKMMRRLYHADD